MASISVDEKPFCSWDAIGRSAAINRICESGAYYYTDIPDPTDWEGYTARLPIWVYLILFLGWGYLMWRLWKRLDK